VDEMRWDDLSEFKTKWPAVSEVHAYRKEAYAQISRVIRDNLSDSKQSVSWKDPMWALFMACEHDRIHLETSSVLIRELPLNLVEAPTYWPGPASSSLPSPKRNVLVSVPGCSVTLGKDKGYPSYGWDNEYGSRQVQVKAFKVQSEKA